MELGFGEEKTRELNLRDEMQECAIVGVIGNNSRTQR